MILSGWGRYPKASCHVIEPRSRDDVSEAICASKSMIAHGNGRAYGDAALNPSGTMKMRGCDCILSFDPETGLLTCEAGVMLSHIIETFAPRGWFPPVTPGTKFVTVGGMIAADVHGKNHHKVGSFGNHVEAFDLALADGRIVTCSRHENAELFAATCGGMGLTGVIVQASFRMMPMPTRLMRRETLRAPTLEAAMDLFEDSRDWTYSVAWIDCISGGKARGRSLVSRAEHVSSEEARSLGLDVGEGRARGSTVAVPIDVPSFVLNRWSLRAFNALYYRLARCGSDYVDFDGYFYPLDSIREWNRLYGASGFFQFQCVLPKPASREGIAALLNTIGRSGRGSFLSVLKLFGPESGLMSFPMEGYTLALDFRADAPSLRLADELDAIVMDHGGRIYLAKDARMTRLMLAGYPELERFCAVRAAADPHEKFSSLQSRRLGL